MRIVVWDGSTDLNRLDVNLTDVGRTDWATLEVAQLQRDAPDAHLQLFAGSELLARASLWLNGPRLSPTERTGLIGHYAAVNAEAGRAILEAACQPLQAAGCARVIGPMDGSTWKSYRLVSDAGSEAPFLLEPKNPLSWNEHFLESGFDVLATYHSNLCLSPAPDERVPRVRERLAAQGITTRAANPAQLDAELEAIHDLALESFSRNFLYSPLSKSDFLELYRPALSKLPPGFTRIAEHGGRAVGFAFAVPDLLRPQMDTLILKTVGVRGGRQYAGLGALLGDELHDLARASAMPRVIHALIHDANVSGNASARTGGVMRRYALYTRPL